MSVHSEFTIEMCCFVHSLCKFLAWAAHGAIDTSRQRTRRIGDDSKLENESKDNRRWLHVTTQQWNERRQETTYAPKQFALLADP